MPLPLASPNNRGTGYAPRWAPERNAISKDKDYERSYRLAA